MAQWCPWRKRGFGVGLFFSCQCIACPEVEEVEQGIGYFTTLYLHLFTPPCLRSGLESPHTPQSSLFWFDLTAYPAILGVRVNAEFDGVVGGG
jgi:hypothetical protein